MTVTVILAVNSYTLTKGLDISLTLPIPFFWLGICLLYPISPAVPQATNTLVVKVIEEFWQLNLQ